MGFENLNVEYINNDIFVSKGEIRVKALIYLCAKSSGLFFLFLPVCYITGVSISYTFGLPGYSFHPNFETSDSNFGASGIRGVAINVKEDLNADIVNFDTVFDDHIWVEIPLANADRLVCGCIYRSPRKEKEAAKKSTNQVRYF